MINRANSYSALLGHQIRLQIGEWWIGFAGEAPVINARCAGRGPISSAPAFRWNRSRCFRGVIAANCPIIHSLPRTNAFICRASQMLRYERSVGGPDWKQGQKSLYFSCGSAFVFLNAADFSVICTTNDGCPQWKARRRRSPSTRDSMRSQPRSR